MATLLTDTLVADFNRFKWLKRLDQSVILNTGEASPDLLKVPEKDAQRVLGEVVRLVLDLPRKSTPLVVWNHGDSELLVHSDQTTINCTSGVVTISVTVECDQYQQVTIPVPIGVGQKKSVTGLVMSSFQDLQGPTGLVEIWSDAIIAFAWETLLELATTICAQVGNDARGLPLVPGTIGASPDRLLIQPVSRFSLTAGV